MASATPTRRPGELRRALLRFAATRAEFTVAEAIEEIGPMYGAEECLRAGRSALAYRTRIGRREDIEVDAIDCERAGRSSLASNIVIRTTQAGLLKRVRRGVYRLA